MSSEKSVEQYCKFKEHLNSKSIQEMALIYKGALENEYYELLYIISTTLSESKLKKILKLC